MARRRGERIRVRLARVGFLATGSLSTPKSAYVFRVFRDSLSGLGYVEGQNLVIEYRGAAGRFADLPRLATELIRLKTDVIVATGSASIRAVKAAMTAAPIVAIDLESDPVASGFVASLAHPGGNTGIFLDHSALSGKWLQLLKDVFPKLDRAAVLWDPAHLSPQLEAIKTAAGAMAIELQPIAVQDAADLEKAFETARRSRAQAVVVLSAPPFSNESPRLARVAFTSRLPTIAPFREFVVAGGMMAYGPDEDANYRRLASMVDKILRGGRPSDIPVERPTRFNLLVNVKTAKALGLTIPQSILVRADEIIQ
jgi:putative tryptophan/tyrosine transport system substrate-binding protein